jgi:ABC-2 type transport system ATP-binding protein
LRLFTYGSYGADTMGRPVGAIASALPVTRRRADDVQPAIFTEGLTKRFGSTLALDGLDLEVHEGEVVGFLGPNGAGKTTTIRLLLGLLIATRGHARLFGLDSRRQAVAAHRRIAYVPGEASLWPALTGEETLSFMARLHGGVDEAYRDLLIERFALDPAKRVRAYSKGNRQKLSLIAGLMTRADLLILDEPTAGLDPLMEVAFRECAHEASERGQTIFLSSHILSEVEALCDRIGILRAGRLIDIGTMRELRHLSAVSVEATFAGPPPDLSRVPGVGALSVEERHLRCQVSGSMAPLVDALAGSDVVNLLSREPSLEELFLAHYGAAQADAGADPRGADAGGPGAVAASPEESGAHA